MVTSAQSPYSILLFNGLMREQKKLLKILLFIEFQLFTLVFRKLMFNLLPFANHQSTHKSTRHGAKRTNPPD
ncbi:MAG: hypothetical protein RL264_1108 [Bacteroidota bacterium]|jgi:hypothetical protein